MSDGGALAAVIMSAGALIAAVLAFITNVRANKTSEKKLTVEEQQTEDQRHRSISEERRKELDRLYERVDKLERIVQELQDSDRKKQQTINDQADELERVRDLFVRFVRRIERAWPDGHTMPTLTDEEKAVLEHTAPRIQGATP